MWIKFVLSYNVKSEFLCDIYEINFVVFKKLNLRKCDQFGGKQYLIEYILRFISTAVLQGCQSIQTLTSPVCTNIFWLKIFNDTL